MRLIFLITSLLALSACANTFDGATKDADRLGQKMQKIADTITEP